MKIIETLNDMIDDEICGIKDYAKLAIKMKDEYPVFAETIFNLSKDEEGHMRTLHEIVTKIISKYRQENGEPPADMLAVYNYVHEKSIEKYEKAKRYQEMYKD